MSKKLFENQIRVTLAAEDDALKERFERADSILLQRPALESEKASTTSQVIRDTFTMPPNDYALIEGHRKRAARLGHIATKSDVIRAGLAALSSLGDEHFIEKLATLERVLPGRKSK